MLSNHLNPASFISNMAMTYYIIQTKSCRLPGPQSDADLATDFATKPADVLAKSPARHTKKTSRLQPADHSHVELVCM